MMTCVPLRYWVDKELGPSDYSNDSFSFWDKGQFSQPRTNNKYSDPKSNVFLFSALKIAHALADQICKAEEVCASSPSPPTSDCFTDHGSLLSTCRSLPTPGPDWASRVNVLLSSSPHPVGIGMKSGDEKETKDDCGEASPNGLHVCGAELLLSNDTGNGHLEEKRQRIHSLGIVFYELFSGERPPDNVSQPGDSATTFLADIFDDTPNNDTSVIDVAGALNILHVLEDDEHLDIDGPMDEERKGPRTASTNKNAMDGNDQVEELRSKGLPNALCDLVANMLDCSNGDFSGEESYSQMYDVRNDLRLMLDKPSKFLHNLDIDFLSLNDLKLTEQLFCRDAEFSTLLKAYQKSLAGESSLVVISGAPGTGKSSLAQKFAGHVSGNGGIFLSGKFDRHNAKPFSAISSAFSEYCQILASEAGTTHFQLTTGNLRLTLGHDAQHLARIIPNLSLILGEDAKTQQLMDNGCVDAQKRLHYLLSKFVQSISNSSKSQIVFFFDDLQWADPASVEAIYHILLMSGFQQSKPPFFLGCVRGDQMDQNSHVQKMISNIRNFGVATTTIKLSCMDKDAVNTMVSEVLNLSPRLTRNLSDIIYHKTKGNPLFFSQLMNTLHREGLLRISLSRRRWEWDEEKIQSKKLPDDVALFFIGTISLLPQDVQTALCTISCFGKSVDISLVKELEKNVDMLLLDPLDVAVQESLLEKLDGRYSFVHDFVQESAYQMIPSEERCVKHFKYGLALCSDSIEKDDCGMIFTAVGQLNRGGPCCITDKAEGTTVAKLNLMAGIDAMEMSDFTSAFWFFDNGISFLRKKHWEEEYQLSIELFDNAARCAFVIGDVVSLKLLSEQVIKFAHSFEDTLNVLYITTYALVYSSKVPEAVEKGQSILRRLGENLPEISSESDVMTLIENTNAIISQMSNDDLLNFKSMKDKSKLMAMKFLGLLVIPIHMIEPSAQPLVTIRIVRLSLSHGMSPISPIGFAYFGAILARCGNIRCGYRFVKLARDLVKRIGSKEVSGEVALISTQVVSFVEPLQSNNDFHIEGQNVAFATGDLNNAMFNCFLHLAGQFYMGTKLTIAKKNFVSARRLMEQQNHVTFLTKLLQVGKKIFALVGEEIEDSPAMRKLELTPLEGNPHQSMTHYFGKMYISFIFRKFDDTKVFAEKYFDCKVKSWLLFYMRSVYAFFDGLISFWIFRETNDIQWAERGRQSKVVMEQWMQNSQWNFSNKYYLLEAEEYFSKGQFNEAKSSYNKAILSAKEHKFTNDEAMGCELAGYFFMKAGMQDSAVECFTRAHEKYDEWGASAKAIELFEFVKRCFAPSKAVFETVPSPPISSPGLSSLSSNESDCLSRASGTRKRNSLI